MGQWPGVFCVTNTVFGRYACILSGGTWTRDRHSRAGFDVDPCCPVCRDTRETPIHKWRVCPGCCGHAPGETCLKTPRARSWPSRGPPLTGSPNARGSAVSSPRRPTETAPPRAPERGGLRQAQAEDVPWKIFGLLSVSIILIFKFSI